MSASYMIALFALQKYGTFKTKTKRATSTPNGTMVGNSRLTNGIEELMYKGKQLSSY